MITTLPTMQGSDKQISWATQIRDEYLANPNMVKLIAMIETGIGPDGKALAMAIPAWALTIQSLLQAANRAGWWIDRKSVVDMRPGPAMADYLTAQHGQNNPVWEA